MPTVRRTDPRSPIEEHILQTIARLDSTVWKHSDRERQERDADVLMRSVVGPEIERRDAEIERQRAKLDAVRALHTMVPGGVFVDKCSCKRPWPCPTAELLEES